MYPSQKSKCVTSTMREFRVLQCALYMQYIFSRHRDGRVISLEEKKSTIVTSDSYQVLFLIDANSSSRIRLKSLSRVLCKHSWFSSIRRFQGHQQKYLSRNAEKKTGMSDPARKDSWKPLMTQQVIGQLKRGQLCLESQAEVPWLTLSVEPARSGHDFIWS